MKGFITFFINYHPDLDQEGDDMLEKAKNFNKELLGKLAENGYGAMFVATTKEACRVEKVDFEYAFPRYIAPHIDVEENDRIVSSIKEKNLNEEED